MSALAERPDLPNPATLRARARALTYDDADPPKSIGLAAEFREHAMAVVDLAKRAGVDEIEYALVAREAERALGRVLLAGRAAGKVAAESQGRNGARRASIPTLPDLGIERHLAADASRFAKVTDRAWEEVIDEALLDEAVSRAAFVKRIKKRLRSRFRQLWLAPDEGTEQSDKHGEDERSAVEELAQLVLAIFDVERGVRDFGEVVALARDLDRQLPNSSA